MKIYWIALFVTSSCFLSAAAQDCSKELLQHKPGTWKAGPQGAIFKVSAPDLVKEKTVINTIHKMIAANYQPSGCQLSYSTVYGNNSPVAGKPWLADNYHYVMRIMRYLCDQQAADKTKYYVDISTTTTVNIVANAIFSLNSLYASELGTDDARGYLKLTSVPVKRDGYYFMGAEKVSYNDSIFEYRWLITYNDTLPFSYVSRKEYLLIQKKRLEQDLINSPSDRAYNEKFFKNIANYLTQPETELSKPAICMWNDEERFEKFVSEGTKGSFIAVKPNIAYYHKSLPKSSPQFFSVVFKLDYADPVFKENIAGIQKAVDFAALKNMLGR
jgi:hypothetical protein